MTLRVEDLKPGDVVRMDLVVKQGRIGYAGLALLGAMFDAFSATDADLAAGNAELVVRPRPVRKGDEIEHLGKYRSIFVAAHDTFIFTMKRGGPEDPLTLIPGDWTHADGSPISWEES